MGATNSTTNYQLSQFNSTDKPAWLQDYNGDMEKIDTAINSAKVTADTAQNTADSAASSVSTVASNVTALQTGVLANRESITDLEGDVNTIESLIGNGTPTAGDHTLIGAINANSDAISLLDFSETMFIDTNNEYNYVKGYYNTKTKKVTLFYTRKVPTQQGTVLATISQHLPATQQRAFGIGIGGTTQMIQATLDANGEIKMGGLSAATTIAATVIFSYIAVD